MASTGGPLVKGWLNLAWGPCAASSYYIYTMANEYHGCKLQANLADDPGVWRTVISGIEGKPGEVAGYGPRNDAGVHALARYRVHHRKSNSVEISGR